MSRARAAQLALPGSSKSSPRSPRLAQPSTSKPRLTQDVLTQRVLAQPSSRAGHEYVRLALPARAARLAQPSSRAGHE